jgi:outer membrane murein-binding lipoprotein Lpp
MSCTKELTMSVPRGCTLGAVLAASSLLAGCVSPQHSLEPDFGRAVHNDIVAQVSDPEPHYDRIVEPASNGMRSAAANRRYETGQVIQPQVQSTSQVAGAGGGGGGAPAGGGQSK